MAKIKSLMKKVDRRKFLKVAGGVLLLTPLGFADFLWKRSGFDNIDTDDIATNNIGYKAGSNILLEAQETTIELVKGEEVTNIWSFMGDRFGKPIVLRQGEESAISVKNLLKNEELGVHWHGIRVPNAMDGVPGLTQLGIKNGDEYEYKYAPADAGTYWYHTHSNTMEQLSRGLTGPLIVLEEEGYEVDQDIILFINDWLLSDDMQIVDNFYNMHNLSHAGRLGNIVTVNGKYNPLYRLKPNTRVRVRLINGSTGRHIAPSFKELTKNTNIIAIDGHPIPPMPYNVFLLAPGMRLDVIIDIPGDKSSSIKQVVDIAYKKEIDLFRLEGQGSIYRTKMLSGMPKSLPKNPLKEPNLSGAIEKEVDLNGGAMSSWLRDRMGRGGMRGRGGMSKGIFWALNDSSMLENGNYDKPLLTLSKDKTYIFKIKNNTFFSHPIHLHGHTFKVLSINGKKLKLPYWTDTILVDRQGEVHIAFVADNIGRWMLHCHVISHQLSGMMGYIEVV